MSEELKPCPFCGSEAKLDENANGLGYPLFYLVYCPNCAAVCRMYQEKDVAIQAWNKRYNENGINREKPKENEKWWHFKGKLYTTLYVAKHTETGEELVIYKNSDGNIFARPLDMFMSEVDREKYPNVKQKYRFERVAQ